MGRVNLSAVPVNTATHGVLHGYTDTRLTSRQSDK